MNLKDKLQTEENELKQRVREVRDDIMFANTVGNKCCMQDFYESIPDMLCTLELINIRECGVIKRVIRGESMESIGELFGLTRERVRQIFYKGMRKAGDLSDLRKRLDEAEEEHKELSVLRKVMESKEKRICELEKMLNVEHEEKEEIPTGVLAKKIADCNLSVRTFNCLRAADIDTVYDLIQYRRVDLLKLRNFGRKSLIELDDFVESLGLEWKS